MLDDAQSVAEKQGMFSIARSASNEGDSMNEDVAATVQWSLEDMARNLNQRQYFVGAELMPMPEPQLDRHHIPFSMSVLLSNFLDQIAGSGDMRIRLFRQWHAVHHSQYDIVTLYNHPKSGECPQHFQPSTVHELSPR